MRVLYTLGRAAFGAFFLYNGINRLKNTDAMAGYAASKRRQSPRLSVQASGVLLAASGAAMMLGIKPRLGALGAVGFLAAASPIFHDFWNAQEPQQKQGDMIHFSKNLALLSAALAFAGDDSCS